MITWDNFKPEVEKAIAKQKMNSIKETAASKWATKLMQPILNTLTLSGIKPLEIGEDYFRFSDGDKVITVKFTCK